MYYLMFVGYFIRYIGIFKIVLIDSIIGILVFDNLFCFIYVVFLNFLFLKDIDFKIYLVRKFFFSD